MTTGSSSPGLRGGAYDIGLGLEAAGKYVISTGTCSNGRFVGSTEPGAARCRCTAYYGAGVNKFRFRCICGAMRTVKASLGYENVCIS